MRRVGSCSPVTKKLLVGIVCFGLFTPGARAVDWNIKSSLSENLEFSDNRKMATNPAGNSYNSVSSLMFDAKALTPTSSAAFIGNLRYLTFAGPGEANSRNTLDKNVTATFTKRAKLTTYNFITSWSQADAATIQLQETGVATVGGSVTTTTFGGGLRHELGPRDTIAWQTSYVSTEFTDPGSTPIASLTSTVDWTHKLSPITVLIPSLQFQRLNYDNAAQTEVTFWKATMGMNTELTKRLSFHAAAGGTLLNGEQNNVGVSANSAVPTSGSVTGWLANAQLIYNPLATVRVVLTAAHTTAPNTFGQINVSDTVGLYLSYDINTVSSLSLSGSVSQQSSAVERSSAQAGSSATESLSAVVAYSRRLTREWRTNLSYRYAQQRRNSNSDLARSNSNSVLFNITRDVTILP